MSEDELKVQMSTEALSEWERLCDCIRQALSNAQLSDEGIRFIRVEGDGTPNDPGRGFMKLPEATAARFTRQWIDTFLWPLIEKRVDRPSRALVDWLLELER